jgi:hypothetical protein
VLALLVMKYTPAGGHGRLFVLDSMTNVGTANMPVLCLLIVMAFVNNWDKLPKKCPVAVSVPLLTNIIIWTNPLHHLYYVNFSVVRSEIVFGPYMYVSADCTTTPA